MEVWLCSFLEFKTSIHASTTFSGDIRVMPCPIAQTEADPPSASHSLHFRLTPVCRLAGTDR
ncbi:MAG: hypothetical protein ACUZ8I_03735 [Candidatus Scalindua sp.]